MYLQKTSKTFCQNYVKNVAYMLKIILLTETPHNLEFFRKFWDIDFFA